MNIRYGPTDPEVLAFISRTAELYPESASQASAVEARHHYETLCAAYNRPLPENVTATDDTLHATAPDRDIPLRRYSIDNKSNIALLYIHGGGWVVGSLESHHSICADLCAGTGLDVIALDYRLCPEHRHPAAIDDCSAVFETLTRDYASVIVGGDSAGGQLTAALCLRSRDNAGPQPIGQLLIYPAVGIPPEGGSYITNANAPGLTTSDVIHYWNVLAGDHGWRTTSDSSLTPANAARHDNLPPAIITSAGFDPLRDDAMVYATRLTDADVPVQWRNDPQLIHGHLRARHDSRIAAANFSWICAALRQCAADSQSQP